jgi:hypothetical protein
MPGQDGTDPVGNDELLYRRVPVIWCDQNGVSPEAFAPREDDVSGISFYREKYKSLQEVAKGKSKKGYFVAVFRARDLRDHGLAVVPRPNEEDDPGHVELPSLRYENRRTPEASQQKVLLATRLCLRVEGPFLPSSV